MQQFDPIKKTSVVPKTGGNPSSETHKKQSAMRNPFKTPSRQQLDEHIMTLPG